MKLKNLRIQNYKSIIDTEEFDVDNITCLVGKNEAGKSAILQALYKLNPVVSEEGKFDPVIEYPAKDQSLYLEEVREDERDHAMVVTSTWQLEPLDLKSIEAKFGENALNSSEIVIKKGYNNVQYWTIDYNETNILGFLIECAELSAKEEQEISEYEILSEIIDYLHDLVEPSEKEQAFLTQLEKLFPENKISSGLIHTLSPQLPKFLYFPEYEKMPGKVAIQSLNDKKAKNQIDLSDKIFLALLRQAGTSIEELNNAQRYEELRAKIEGTQNRISDQIFEYWTQNTHLQVKVGFDAARPGDPPPFNNGFIVRTRIENTRHRASVDFDERSTGFVWFFSFLV